MRMIVVVDLYSLLLKSLSIGVRTPSDCIGTISAKLYSWVKREVDSKSNL